jgi:cytochrome c553
MKIQCGPLSISGALAIVLAVAGFVPQSAAQGNRGASTAVERGKYLVNITGCNDCHSPKKDAQNHTDETRMLGGRPSTTAVPSATPGEVHSSLDLTAWTGPWGTTYASNLTPDPVTGLVSRRYNEMTFVSMFRTGKKPNGIAILPPMPWENYSSMTDEDLKAIWAYLQTIKPVRNQVPANVPPPAAPTRGK